MNLKENSYRDGGTLSYTNFPENPYFERDTEICIDGRIGSDDSLIFIGYPSRGHRPSEECEQFIRMCITTHNLQKIDFYVNRLSLIEEDRRLCELLKKKRFKIDFFELSFLAETCIPPVPIARGMFWKELIDNYHDQLTTEERAQLHEWLNRNWKYTEGLEKQHEDILCFEARYNPNNQYKVWYRTEKESRLTNVFLYNGEYHTASNRWIAPEYIEKTEKLC